jgi:hypothetical protein
MYQDFVWNRYALSKNISRTGPRSRRSLGFARDDKGEGGSSIKLALEVLGTIFRKPGLESVEQRNRVLNMLIGELVIAAFHVVLYQVFEFGPNLHIHTFRLPQSRARSPGTGAEGYRLDKWAEPDSHQSKRLTHNPGRAIQS